MHEKIIIVQWLIIIVCDFNWKRQELLLRVARDASGELRNLKPATRNKILVSLTF